MRGGPEDGLPHVGLDEVEVPQAGVPQVPVRIPMREVEARQRPGQVRRQAAQFRQVQHELRDRTRLAVAPQGLLQTVGLGRHVVDDDDGRGFRIAGRRPAAVQLVAPALVDCGLYRAAGPRQRLEVGVDSDAVVERIVRTRAQQPFEVDLHTHTQGLSRGTHAVYGPDPQRRARGESGWRNSQRAVRM